jgi:hypothetical protein
LTDLPCALCHSTAHLSDECGLIERAAIPSTEAPANSILRAIVHRLFLSVTALREFHLGPRVPRIEHQEPYDLDPAKETPDYLASAIRQCVDDFLAFPNITSTDIRNQHPGCLLILQLYHSKAFAHSFEQFREIVAVLVEQRRAE